MSEAVHLPYFCPTLSGGSYFKRRPCEGQLAAAKDRQIKFPHAIMPYGLEQCLKCGGKGLVIREATVKPDLTVRKEESGVVYPVRIGTPEAEAPCCPKHPAEPQVQCGPDSKRAGQYLGACKVCMAERKVGRGPKKTEKMTPAVARDLRKGGSASVKGAMVFKSEAEAAVHVPESKTSAPSIPPVMALGEIPTCPRPDCEAPGSPVKIDKLGRSMGMCQACVSARGRRGAIEAHTLGKPPAPLLAMFDDPKHADLKKWLEEQAAEYERTLLQEIIYRLKLAMREAGAHG